MSLDAREQEKLRNQLDNATAAIKQAKAGKLQGIENAYGLAYNKAAQAGMVMPLKKKYRGR